MLAISANGRVFILAGQEEARKAAFQLSVA
jgi:hypothetical protein